MNKEALFSELYRKVIQPDSGCAGCGVCVLVCPFHLLVLENNRPLQLSDTKDDCPKNRDGRCGLCARVCPRIHGLENPGSSAEPYGSYRRILFARSTDAVFNEKGQDGGLISTMMKWGLQTGRWKSFIGYGRDSAWRILPQIVTDANDVIKTSGSKYTYYPFSESLAALKNSRMYSSPYVMVGVPCQISAMRRLQEMKSPVAKELALTVGLFCSESFSYQGLIEQKFVGGLGIPIEQVKKMDIKKGAFQIEMDSGENHAIPLKELHEYSHPGCGLCPDFTAEEADISVGGLGVGGWNAVIIRSPEADRLFDELNAAGLIETRSTEEYAKAMGLLEKMSSRKRDRRL